VRLSGSRAKKIWARVKQRTGCAIVRQGAAVYATDYKGIVPAVPPRWRQTAQARESVTPLEEARNRHFPENKGTVLAVTVHGQLSPWGRPFRNHLQGSGLSTPFFIKRSSNSHQIRFRVSRRGYNASRKTAIWRQRHVATGGAHAPADAEDPRPRRAGRGVPPVGPALPAARRRAVPGRAPVPPARRDPDPSRLRQPQASGPLVALVPRRTRRSRIVASSSATRRSSAAIRWSRSRQPRQATVAMTPLWPAGKGAAAPSSRVNGYVVAGARFEVRPP
jgi:hypothetical protein